MRTATGSVAVDGVRMIGPDGKVITSRGPPVSVLALRTVGGLAQWRKGRAPKAQDEVAINAALAKLGGFEVCGPISVLTLTAEADVHRRGHLRLCRRPGLPRWRDIRGAAGASRFCRSRGWTILAFPGLAVILGLIAAIIPAVRASRTAVLRAITYE